MKSPPRRQNLALLMFACVAISIYSLLGYTTGVVPFPLHHAVAIEKSVLCESLGNESRALKQLRTTLPPRSRHSSSEKFDPLRQQNDSTWKAHCFIYGEGEQLLFAKVELAATGPPEAWLNDPRSGYMNGSPSHRFQAGEVARMTERTAEILVPCLPRGEFPFGSYKLGVLVHAQDPLDGTPEQNREALATLAIGMAKFSYEHARCSEPANLPDEVTGIRPV